MFAPKDFVIFPEDLYRLAVSSSPKMTHVRPVEDVDLHEQNGVVMVVANHRGVSLRLQPPPWGDEAASAQG